LEPTGRTPKRRTRIFGDLYKNELRTFILTYYK